MFLHLGGDVVVAKSDIIAILDVQFAKNAAVGWELLQAGSDGSPGVVKRIAEKGKEKTCVLTTKRIYLSPISSVTLFKRSQNTLLSGKN